MSAKRVMDDPVLWGKILRHEFMDVLPKFLHAARLQLVHKQLEWLIASTAACAPNWHIRNVTKGWFPNWLTLGIQIQIAFQRHNCDRHFIRLLDAWQYDADSDDEDKPVRWNQDGETMFDHSHQVGKPSHWYGSRSHVWQEHNWSQPPTRSNAYLKLSYGKKA